MAGPPDCRRRAIVRNGSRASDVRAGLYRRLRFGASSADSNSVATMKSHSAQIMSSAARSCCALASVTSTRTARMHLHWRQNTFGHVRSLITMSQSSWFVWRGGASANEPATSQLKKLAAHGARARLEGLRAEIAAITRAFPGVASGDTAAPRRRRRRGRKAAAATPAATNGRRRRRRRGKLSAAGRAAISAAQKKRWAAIKRKKAASES